jgi:hypothetical protein
MPSPVAVGTVQLFELARASAYLGMTAPASER